MSSSCYLRNKTQLFTSPPGRFWGCEGLGGIFDGKEQTARGIANSSLPSLNDDLTKVLEAILDAGAAPDVK